MHLELFDRPVERRGTDCLKYDFAAERGKPEGVLPLWVADMDFPAPPCVLDKLHGAVRHGIFGYSDTKPDYAGAVRGWFASRYGWAIEDAWLVKTPGVVFALAAAVRAFTEAGDGVLLQPPVYYPFFEVIRDNGRRVVENPLVLRDGRYEIDFEDFEAKAAQEHVKLFLLCSPHNPVGRVWTVDELRTMGEICLRHDIIVVSDEIHCDLTLPGYVHHVLPEAVPELTDRAVVCTSPSKTFNLAGLQVSNIFIPSPALRTQFRKAVSRTGYAQLNALGIAACKAAYRDGAAWQADCRQYLNGNLELIRGFLRSELPGLKLIEPEGTYFAWIDCAALGLSDRELEQFVTERAGLWLDSGYIFGSGGEGFQRLAYACQRATLERALNQLRDAVAQAFPGLLRQAALERSGH